MRVLTPYYDDGTCVIYHADCRDVLPEMKGASLVFADPPYGVGFEYGDAYTDAAGREYDNFMVWVADECQRLAPRVLITPGIRNLWRWTCRRSRAIILAPNPSDY